MTVAKSPSGYDGRAASYWSATSPNTSACSRVGSPAVIRSGGLVRGGELVHEIEDARGATGHLHGGQELFYDPARDLVERERGGKVRVREHYRLADVAPFRHRAVD